MSIKFLVLAGGEILGWGGGSADLIFMGAGIFLALVVFSLPALPWSTKLERPLAFKSSENLFNRCLWGKTEPC